MKDLVAGLKNVGDYKSAYEFMLAANDGVESVSCLVNYALYPDWDVVIAISFQFPWETPDTSSYLAEAVHESGFGPQIMVQGDGYVKLVGDTNEIIYSTPHPLFPRELGEIVQKAAVRAVQDMRDQI